MSMLRTIVSRIRAQVRRRRAEQRIDRLYGLIIDQLDAGKELVRPDFDGVAKFIAGTGERPGRVLVGITAHKSPACVIDQVENLRKSAPEAGVVLHLSKPLQ